MSILCAHARICSPAFIFCKRSAQRMMSTVVWLLALFCSLLQPVISIPLENFYPYGNGTGDLALPQTTGDPPVTSPGYSLASPFPFYGANHSTLFVSVCACMAKLTSAECFNHFWEIAAPILYSVATKQKFWRVAGMGGD